MSRARHLLQRLMNELRLRREDIRKNASAISVDFEEHTDGSFTVHVVWNDKGTRKEYIKLFDKNYCFGDVPDGAEQQQPPAAGRSQIKTAGHRHQPTAQHPQAHCRHADRGAAPLCGGRHRPRACGSPAGTTDPRRLW